MMKKFLLTGLFMTGILNIIQGQVLMDYTLAAKNSMIDPGGSTRLRGMGGVGVALGADAGSINHNPAGIGLIARSEVQGSINIGLAQTTSNYNDNSNLGFKGNFNFPNLSAAFNMQESPASENKFKGATIGISINRVANFHDRFVYGGDLFNASITDYFAHNANVSGYTLDEAFDEFDNATTYGDGYQFLTSEGLAFGNYLIDYQSGWQTYFPINGVNFEETFTTKGAMNAVNFAAAGNYDDKIYFGATLTATHFRYDVERNYTEKTIKFGPNDPFYNLNIIDKYNASGWGVDLTAGVIVRPIESFRFGLSLKTPSYYSINETSDTEMKVNFANVLDENNNPLGFLDGKLVPFEGSFNMLTPMRTSLGAAYFFEDKALVTMDVDFVNYNWLQLTDPEDPSGYFNSAAQKEIRNNLNSTFNIRIGGEYRYEIFFVRAGFARYGDPFSSNFDDIDRSRKHISFGFGARFKYYFWDFAYENISQNSGYQPYNLEGFEPYAKIKNNYHNLFLTYGAYF